ncbi:MAG TPA: anhydro-N-acetylmuramic acid kinase, partial [Gammaproteobacteria bacterium]|nr:anhydro-N-acetylmuramic acid kinase [Gammaproteobacteria bacterium]
MENPYYVGLMSGTSLDGIDAILVQFSKAPSCKIIATHFHKIPKLIREQILSLTMNPTCSLIQIGTLNTELGSLFADSVLSLLKKASVTPSQIKAIGSHGQTLWHAPNQAYPFSWQIGNPAVIAARTKIMTIADFRSNDVACGGQGAPFAPAFHQWLFQDKNQNRFIVNIGGISNITVLTTHSDDVIGYDTGPGNALLDAWCQKNRNLPFDQDGQWASQGKCDETLLEKLLADPYFQRLPPKSTGKEFFNLAWLAQYLKERTYQPEDVQATLVALTAQCIVSGLLSYSNKGCVYLCGGGTHNEALVSKIRERLPPSFTLDSTEPLGLDPDWVEAACFAWLAKQRAQQQPINLCAITGSKHP